MSIFSVRVPAKWVLAGEHAVLRGAEAIALPHPELGLWLRFEPGGSVLRVANAESEAMVREALELAGVAPPNGALTIESTIPRGAGLGSSAAFAVALASWLAPEPDRQRFAKAIEDRLHGGTSSGMDVAVVLSGKPIRFRKGEPAVALELARLPRFTLHDTGVRSLTSACIAKVAELHARDAGEAERIDQQMIQAGLLRWPVCVPATATGSRMGCDWPRIASRAGGSSRRKRGG